MSKTANDAQIKFKINDIPLTLLFGDYVSYCFPPKKSVPYEIPKFLLNTPSSNIQELQAKYPQLITAGESKRNNCRKCQSVVT